MELSSKEHRQRLRDLSNRGPKGSRGGEIVIPQANIERIRQAQARYAEFFQGDVEANMRARLGFYLNTSDPETLKLIPQLTSADREKILNMAERMKAPAPKEPAAPPRRRFDPQRVEAAYRDREIKYGRSEAKAEPEITLDLTPQEIEKLRAAEARYREWCEGNIKESDMRQVGFFCRIDSDVINLAIPNLTTKERERLVRMAARMRSYLPAKVSARQQK
jgi:hypothetical protein